jgi:hypothetical protein
VRCDEHGPHLDRKEDQGSQRRPPRHGEGDHESDLGVGARRHGHRARQPGLQAGVHPRMAWMAQGGLPVGSHGALGALYQEGPGGAQQEDLEENSLHAEWRSIRGVFCTDSANIFINSRPTCCENGERWRRRKRHWHNKWKGCHQAGSEATCCTYSLDRWRGAGESPPSTHPYPFVTNLRLQWQLEDSL